MADGAGPPPRLRAVVESHGWVQTAPFAWRPVGPALVRPERVGGRVLDLELADHGDGVRLHPPADATPEERQALDRRAARMLQREHDLAGFHDALAFDPALQRDLAARGAARVLAGSSLFEDVVKAILATNTSWRRAVTVIGATAALSPDRAFPAPGHLLDAGEDGLRAAGAGYRAPFLLDVARAAGDGELDRMDAAFAVDPAGPLRDLRGLRGVGPATAAFVALLAGRYEAVGIDSATRRIAARRWFGGRRPTDRQIERRIRPAGRFRGLALFWSTMRGWRIEEGLWSDRAG